MRDVKEEQEEEQKEQKVEENKHEKVVELDEVEEEDSMEWELRNTDSVFSELSELSRDFVESVDRGASVRGKLNSHICHKQVVVHCLRVNLRCL